jgi:hypothetical protein
VDAPLSTAETDRLLIRCVLGAVGVAQWVVLALPWVEGRDDETELLDGQLSGWRLFQAGWSRPDGVDTGELVVIGALPPTAWLLALGLLAGAVVYATRWLAALSVVGSVLAALGILGLYMTGPADTHGWLPWDFQPVLFAGLSLWAVAAALASRLAATEQR